MKRHNAQRARWLAAAALLTAVGVLLGYYYAHKPLLPQTALALALAFFDMAVAAGIVALAGGLGHRLAPSIHAHPLANLAVQAALGLGVLALAALSVGAIGGLTPLVGWIALGAGLSALSRDIRTWLRQWAALGDLLRRASQFEKALACLLALIVGASLLQALAPPIQFDALVYHLLLPRVFQAQRSIALVPDIPYWGNPLAGEMLYTWALLLARPQAAALVGWMAGIIACIGVLGLGASAHRTSGWVAVAALLAGESVSSALGWAYVDWLAALYGMAMLGALTAGSDSSWRRAFLAGLLAGFGFGTKYTAGVLMASGAAAMLVAWPRGRPGRSLLAFAGAALLAASPWLLKNWLAAGSPLYPYAGDSPWISAAQQAALRSSVSGLDVLRALLLPIAATFQGHEKAPGFSASIGPLLLGLSAGALVVPRRLTRVTGTAAVFVGTGWLIWAAASLLSPLLVQTRLYFGLLPAWALLAGYGYAGVSRVRLGKVRLRRLLQAVIGIALAFTAISSGVATLRERTFAPTLGLESDGDYRLRNLGAVELALRAVNGLPEGRRAMLLWEPRAFGCWPRCSPDAWIDRWYLERSDRPSTQAVLGSWKAQGFTDLLVNLDGMAFVQEHDRRYREEDWAALAQLLESLPDSQAFGEGYRLYRLP